MERNLWIGLGVIALAVGCAAPDPETAADLIIENGRVYTFTWDDPAPDGAPAPGAPHSDAGWSPDAEAVAVKDGEIVFVGSNTDVEQYRGSETEEMDVGGATVLPGLIDSHTHVMGLGQLEVQVNLIGVETEEEAIQRVIAATDASGDVPEGEWILARGWDEGAWATSYPTWERLSESFPNNPVIMDSLHSFAVWGNRRAFEAAGVTKDTPDPSGGEILRDGDGNPTGIVLNRAGRLLRDAVPEPTDEQFKQFILAGLNRMARDGYVSVHEAGVDSRFMTALEELEAADELPIRVYAMISARDGELCRQWIEKGPVTDNERMLITRSVKAFYDGALGSRGARLLEDYSDRPGHKGVAGGEYGFDTELVAELMRSGFQVGIHAIGDAGNRETLDFLASVVEADPKTRALRHRIEHAQVVHLDDFERFSELELIASMEPAHCVEDKTWAEDRLGPHRVKGAYAWRTLRKNGVRLAFNSDLIGSDHDIFYGLHSAITRRDKELQPPEGWYPEEAMTSEEAVRGYTIWGAYAGGLENEMGTLELGKWADITVMDIDPLVVGDTEPRKLFDGNIVTTIVAGKVLYKAE